MKLISDYGKSLVQRLSGVLRTMRRVVKLAARWVIPDVVPYLKIRCYPVDFHYRRGHYYCTLWPVTCWCRPLLAENDLDVGSRGTLHVVTELPRNSRFVDNTFSPSRWRFRVQARIVRLDSVSTFNVHAASLSDYDHLCGYQYLNINSHVRNLSFLTLNQRFEPINGSSHLLTWNYIL